jgi:hypothetical protein
MLYPTELRAREGIIAIDAGFGWSTWSWGKPGTGEKKGERTEVRPLHSP